MKEMEAQLKSWSLKIDRLTAKTERPGVPVRFEALMYVDELKVLHAIAQAKLDAFRVVGSSARAGLKVEMENAWSELDAAITRPMPAM